MSRRTCCDGLTSLCYVHASCARTVPYRSFCAAATAGPPSDDNNVFVKGFDRSQGEEAVREALTTLFSDAGEVANVRLPTDRETGELKGFGFIEFADNAGKVSQKARA